MADTVTLRANVPAQVAGHVAVLLGVDPNHEPPAARLLLNDGTGSDQRIVVSAGETIAIGDTNWRVNEIATTSPQGEQRGFGPGPGRLVLVAR